MESGGLGAGVGRDVRKNLERSRPKAHHRVILTLTGRYQHSRAQHPLPSKPTHPSRHNLVSPLAGSLHVFSRLGSLAPGISRSSSLVPFAGPLIPLRFKSPLSCFFSPGETGNFLRAEVVLCKAHGGGGTGAVYSPLAGSEVHF